MSSVVIYGDTSGAITVTANATAGTNTLTLAPQTGTLNVAGPAFSAYLGTNTSLSSGTQKVTFDTEEFDTNSNFASSRFTPTVAGYYIVCGNVCFTGTTDIQASIFKNGSAYKYGPYVGSTAGASMEVSAVVYCNGTTDYIEIYAYTTSGNTLSGASTRTWFNGCLLRGA